MFVHTPIVLIHLHVHVQVVFRVTAVVFRHAWLVYMHDYMYLWVPDRQAKAKCVFIHGFQQYWFRPFPESRQNFDQLLLLQDQNNKARHPITCTIESSWTDYTHSLTISQTRRRTCAQWLRQQRLGRAGTCEPPTWPRTHLRDSPAHWSTHLSLGRMELGKFSSLKLGLTVRL